MCGVIQRYINVYAATTEQKHRDQIISVAKSVKKGTP